MTETEILQQVSRVT